MISRDRGNAMKPSDVSFVDEVPSSSSATYLAWQDHFCSLLVVGIDDRTLSKAGRGKEQENDSDLDLAGCCSKATQIPITSLWIVAAVKGAIFLFLAHLYFV